MYDDGLDVELASSDLTQLFTTAKRKAAINTAQVDFARLTSCTKRYATPDLSDEQGEYDLYAYLCGDFMRLAGDPSILIVDANDVQRYIQGPISFPKLDPEELDRLQPGWRAAPAGVPSGWYMRDDGGSTFLGCTPAPDIATGETWSWNIPYIARPADMTNATDQPFTFDSRVLKRLIPFHQALVHKAAALLEPLRKNYSGAQRQTQLYSGYVAQFLQQGTEDGGEQITFARSYLSESIRRSGE